jgi:hypothetical protein
VWREVLVEERAVAGLCDEASESVGVQNDGVNLGDSAPLRPRKLQ